MQIDGQHSINPQTAPIDGIVAPAAAHLARLRGAHGPRSLATSQPKGAVHDAPAGPSYLATVGQSLPPRPPSGGGGPAVPTRQLILDPWVSGQLTTYA